MNCGLVDQSQWVKDVMVVVDKYGRNRNPAGERTYLEEITDAYETLDRLKAENARRKEALSLKDQVIADLEVRKQQNAKAIIEAKKENKHLRARVEELETLLGPLAGEPQDEPDHEGWWLYCWEQTGYLGCLEVRCPADTMMVHDSEDAISYWDESDNYLGRWLALGDLSRFWPKSTDDTDQAEEA